MTKTLALHLSGPLQSWATTALVKTRVDTDRAPKAKAIRGMLAACYGIPRGQEYPKSIQEAKINIVTLNSGSVIRDFQIISNRAGEEEYLNRIGQIMARGRTTSKDYKVAVADNNGGNSIVRRTYLGDASFLVLITGATPNDTDLLNRALLDPVWSPYLGKRAFSPTFPFMLGYVESNNAENEAKERLSEILGQDKEDLPYE